MNTGLINIVQICESINKLQLSNFSEVKVFTIDNFAQNQNEIAENTQNTLRNMHEILVEVVCYDFAIYLIQNYIQACLCCLFNLFDE